MHKITPNEKKKSKASLTVDLQIDERAVGDGISAVLQSAESILSAEVPTKCQRKALVETAQSLLVLQKTIVKKVPSLISDDCSQYSLARVSVIKNHEIKTQSLKCAPRENLRVRTYDCLGTKIPLPSNTTQYSAEEAFTILSECEADRAAAREFPPEERRSVPSLTKVITSMFDYKNGALIPCSVSSMFRIFNAYKKNPKIEWPVKGRPPILSTSAFISAVDNFELDQNRAVGKADMNLILKNAKVEVARKKCNSTLVVSSPNSRSCRNYMALLPQLDASRGTTLNVQQKSEARYIAERSIRNVISHVMSVAVSHYMLGTQDCRLRTIDTATDGAKRLHELIKKENNEHDIRVVLPMYVSTTDDTTVFAFEGAVAGKQSKFIIKKNENGVRSAFTKDTTSTDSLRGIRIRHSFTFNAVGNAAPFYATIYGLTAEELPVSSCPSGVYTLPVPGFCYGGAQDCANESIGYIVFLRSSSKEDEISTDQTNHEQYRNNIFLPFVSSNRKHYGHREGWTEGDPIDDENVWVVWQVRLSSPSFRTTTFPCVDICCPNHTVSHHHQRQHHY